MRQAQPALDGDARDAVLKQRFIRGMSPAIRLRLYENPALTYAQCINTARQLQAAVKQLADEGVSTTPIAVEAGPLTRAEPAQPVAVKVEPQAQANSLRPLNPRFPAAPSGSNSERLQRPLTCFNCGRGGHKKVDCQAPLNPVAGPRQPFGGPAVGRQYSHSSQQSGVLTCFKCHGQGHKAAVYQSWCSDARQCTSDTETV